jgi:hypothetical protein
MKTRTLLLIWCALGAVVIGGMAYVERQSKKYPDVAVRANGDVYFIPREMIDGKGMRVDLMRVAGCWDAREPGILPIAPLLSDCGSRQAIKLGVPAKSLGPDAEISLRGKPLQLTFWPMYEAPTEHVPDLEAAWAGKNEWAGRKVVLRADWQLFRVEAAGSPWVHLLAAEPQKGDAEELQRLYAGRCYRPEKMTDAGITCSFIQRIGQTAAVEFELGPDEMMSVVQVREGLRSATSTWKKQPAS